MRPEVPARNNLGNSLYGAEVFRRGYQAEWWNCDARPFAPNSQGFEKMTKTSGVWCWAFSFRARAASAAACTIARAKRFKNFSIGSNIHRPSPNQAGNGSDPNTRLAAANSTALPNQTLANPTEAKVRVLWGEPDSSSKEEDGVVVWHYKTDLRWIGVEPIIFVPIPIIADRLELHGHLFQGRNGIQNDLL